MAKRPTPRAKANDQAAAPVTPKPKRARAAAPAAAKQRAADVPASEPSVDDIRRRAYERYQERGGNHGRHFDDWVEAEKELRTKK